MQESCPGAEFALLPRPGSLRRKAGPKADLPSELPRWQYAPVVQAGVGRGHRSAGLDPRPSPYPGKGCLQHYGGLPASLPLPPLLLSQPAVLETTLGFPQAGWQ